MRLHSAHSKRNVVCARRYSRALKEPQTANESRGPDGESGLFFLMQQRDRAAQK